MIIKYKIYHKIINVSIFRKKERNHATIRIERDSITLFITSRGQHRWSWSGWSIVRGYRRCVVGRRNRRNRRNRRRRGCGRSIRSSRWVRRGRRRERGTNEINGANDGGWPHQLFHWWLEVIKINKYLIVLPNVNIFKREKDTVWVNCMGDLGTYV